MINQYRSSDTYDHSLPGTTHAFFNRWLRDDQYILLSNIMGQHDLPATMTLRRQRQTQATMTCRDAEISVRWLPLTDHEWPPNVRNPTDQSCWLLVAPNGERNAWYGIYAMIQAPLNVGKCGWLDTADQQPRRAWFWTEYHRRATIPMLDTDLDDVATCTQLRIGNVSAYPAKHRHSQMVRSLRSRWCRCQ